MSFETDIYFRDKIKRENETRPVIVKNEKLKNSVKRITNEKVNKRIKQDPDRGITRRGFLKFAAAGAGAVILGGGVKKGVEYFVDLFEKKDEDEETEEVETPEQEEIYEEDLKSIQQILDYNKPGRLEFNLGTVEKLKTYWKMRYQENPKLNQSLKDAYRQMGQWRPGLEKTFDRYGLPKEYMFLAIPESHWQTHAVSPAKACGPYQFMASTARMYGLKMNEGVDERRDPLKSGKACARLLSDLYQASGDWSLALSGYNGGFLWKYLSRCKGQGESACYKDFTQFMENKINQTRENVRASTNFTERIRKAGDLQKYANKYQVDKQEIMKLSKITDERKIRKGQIIFIPAGETQKQIKFKQSISGFSENLNYPAKFYAILELIKEGKAGEQDQPLSFDTKIVRQEKAGHNFYQVKKGETFYSVSRKFNVKVSDLTQLNREAVRRGLMAGQEIKIPKARVVPESLESLAAKSGKTIGRMRTLNPAVASSKNPLPDGYEIRV